ncbi:hypothetical protein WIW49_00240 [Xanthomonas euroxanthea]
MPVFDYQKQAQDYYSKVPAIVLGSGASAAHGMSGMGNLAIHLQANTSLSELAESDLKVWRNFCAMLDAKTDLESALQQVTASEALTGRIVSATWDLISVEDANVFKQSLSDPGFFL